MFIILLIALFASSAFADTLNYAYDEAGRLVRVVYPNGKTLSYTYDKAGNLLNRNVSAGVTPFITSVVNGADFQPGVAAATWITIFGTGLAFTTRTWDGSDFPNNNLPTQSDGVSVTVNGTPAYMYYISPTQINALAPDDNSAGPVQVQVTNSLGASNAFTVNKSITLPAFFLFTTKYVAAIHSDGTLVGPPGLIAGDTSAPARPGEAIQVFGTGFGPSNPALPAGKVVVQPANLSGTITVRIAGQPATAAAARLISPGVDRLDVTIPSGTPDGDAAIVAVVNGVPTPTGLFITVHK